MTRLTRQLAHSETDMDVFLHFVLARALLRWPRQSGIFDSKMQTKRRSSPAKGA